MNGHPSAVGEWPCVLVWRATDPRPESVGGISAPPPIEEEPICRVPDCTAPTAGRFYLPTVTAWRVFSEEWRAGCEKHLTDAANGRWVVRNLDFGIFVEEWENVVDVGTESSVPPDWPDTPALLDIVRSLAYSDPIASDARRERYCAICGGMENPAGEEVEHVPSCPFLRAREMIVRPMLPLMDNVREQIEKIRGTDG